MAVINTNITSLIGQQNLNKSQSSLQTAMERLSSGSRINSAKDDAAGQAIANRMSSQITGLTQAQRNANDGISVAQTAEGALNQVNDNLQRIRELTVQATNGTNSDSDLESIQNEIAQRLGEIDRISAQTDFNGTKVLDGSKTTISIQVGSDDGQTISINLKKMDSASLGLGNFQVGTSFNTKPDISLGDALTVVGTATVTSLSDEQAAGAFDRNISLDSAKIGTFSGTNVDESDFSDFVTDDTGAVFAKFDNSSDPVEYYAVDSSSIDKDGNMTFNSADVKALGDLSGGSEASTGETQVTLSITPDTSGTINLPNSESPSSVVEDVSGSGNYYVKSDAGNYYAIDKASVNNDGSFDLTATAPQQVSIQDGSGNSVTGDLREIEDASGAGTGTYVVEKEDGTLLAVDNVTAGVATIKEATYTDAEGNSQTVSVKLGSNSTEYVTVGDKEYNASDVEGKDLSTNPDALKDLELSSTETSDPLAALDKALSSVDSLRSDLGAIQNRFDSAITNLSTTTTNLSAARSRIEDADYATEVSNMTRAQILQQAGTSVLAQANQVPQSVLSLLG